MKSLSNSLPAVIERHVITPRGAQSVQVLPRDDKPTHKISKRANYVWQRWLQFYGAIKLESFGDWPGPDLCELIDSLNTPAAFKQLLIDTRAKHPIWPPTAGEFAQLIEAVQPTATVDYGKLWARTCDYIAAKHWHKLTFQQQRGLICAPNGVAVPADGDSPGFFVTFEEAGNAKN